MAGVTAMKWNLVKMIGVAGVALTLAGCPELALKGVIRGLASPGNPGSVKVSKGASSQFLVRWVDPADKDVDHIEISLRSPLASDAPPAPVEVPVGVQAATVTVPYNNVQYIVTVRSVDKAGNKSPGSVYSPMSWQTAISSIFGTPVLLLPTAQNPPKTMLTYTAYPLTSAAYSTDYTYTNGLLTLQARTTLPSTSDGQSTFTYDSRGNLIRQNDYDTTDTYIADYYSYTYDSNNNQLTKTYSSGGSAIISPSLNSQDQYQYDASGNVIEDDQYDNTLAKTGYITYQYDQNGRLTGGAIYGLSSGVFVVQDTFTGTWDSNTGYPASLIILDGSGNTVIGLNWSISGTTLTEDVAFNFFGSGTFTETWAFDPHGLLNRIDVSGSSGYSANYQYTHYTNGDLNQEVDNTNSGATFSQGFSWTY
jgi:YD repeat-containing protein